MRSVITSMDSPPLQSCWSVGLIKSSILVFRWLLMCLLFIAKPWSQLSTPFPHSHIVHHLLIVRIYKSWKKRVKEVYKKVDIVLSIVK